RPRLPRLRDRDPDEHPRRQGGTARTGGPQLRARPHLRAEQPARGARRHARAEDDLPGVAAQAHRPPGRAGRSIRGRPRRGMRTSVVICVYTKERWDDIREAVESVRAQRRQPHELILVVDYNPDLQLELKKAYPDAIVVENTHEKGLSGGKNTGAETATGDIVAYLDDDAVADPGWLEALEGGFQSPEVVGVGGRTVPRWATGGRPRWFPGEFDWTVGCTYTGMPTVRAPVINVMGGNAAFRREVIGEVGGFHTGIGRSVQGRKNRPLGCEET